jgi:hypothetical protein
MSDITPPEQSFQVGQAVQVEWFGAWWVAEVLAVKKRGLRVHYRDWGPEWDETVPFNRVRPVTLEELAQSNGPFPLAIERPGGPAPFPTEMPPPPWFPEESGGPPGQPVKTTTPLKPGDRLHVEQYGAWWPGEVLAVRDSGTVRIHYTGWEASWDEEVPRSRLRIERPDIWEELEGRRVLVRLDGAIVLDGTLLESGPDHLVLGRSDGKRLIVNRARMLYCETEG